MSDTEIIDPHYPELIETIIKEWKFGYPFENHKTEESILKMSPSEQVTLAVAMLRWYQQNTEGVHQQNRWQISDAMLRILQRKLPFSLSEILEFLAVFQTDIFLLSFGMNRIAPLLQNYLKENSLTSELQTAVERICQLLDGQGSSQHKCATKLRKLISSGQVENPILLGEFWADTAIQYLQALSESEYQSWLHLLEECTNTNGGKPTAKWLKTVHSYREIIGNEKIKQVLLQWFPLVDHPRTQPLNDWRGNADLITDRNADILKGLVWLCADSDDADIARTLSKLAVSAYRKIPQIGPRCIKLGNACIWSLSQMSTPEAIAQLSLLKVKVKFGTAQKGIEKAFIEAAQRAGISREDIEELAVPTYGLTEVGLRQDTLGDFTAKLMVTGTHTTIIRWLKSDGKLQKSVPQSVKNEYPEELKSLKQAEKDIQKMLPAQRDRLESLYLQQKTWDFATWQERYLNHPLLGSLARRLLWQLEDDEHHAVGIWYKGQLRDRSGNSITWLKNDSKVSLWHPICSSPEIIREWRNWLMEHEIQQPFKQAHREIYLLTPAEENTRVYSNRFAAHILKQHQFNALCAQRGWKNKLRLMVDDNCPPASLLLTKWDLRAEFWIEGVGEEYGADTNETGTFYYLATDQVRFYPLNAPENYAHACGGGYASYSNNTTEPIPLSEIPALVFTEVMRDVDLFVGVASVGNDPNWSDGGPVGRHLDYWQSYSFGELSTSALTRRQVLESLIPRLKKIRDRCSFQDRFLVVKGDLRTYKIHLGSSNILMEPNGQYLCIVKAPEKSSESDRVFLPFEGDKTLAVILSKAFLLAEDTKITDPSILSQIHY